VKNRFTSYRTVGRISATVFAMFALVLALSSLTVSAAPGGPDQKTPPTKSAAAPLVTQYFQDVSPGSFFYTATAQLFVDGVVSGYTCGAAPAGACVPPDNLPYYVSGNAVTRGQMSLYVNNTRSKPYSTGLSISTTDYTALYAQTTSGGYGVQAECVAASTNCYAVEGYALAGDYAGYFYGGKGNHLESSDANYAAVDGVASGSGAYAGTFSSTAYRGLLSSNPNAGYNNLRVDGQGDNTHTAADILGGNLIVENDLIVNGSKTGYVVDIMKNAGSTALEPGDVVMVAGDASAAVLGDIPAPSITLADSANDSAVIGIVDAPVYVPDAATKSAYDAQQQADRDAAAAAASQNQGDGKQKQSAMADIKNRISDDEGTIHRATNTDSVAVDGYCNVVTLGSYKGVKVDASFGPIKAGDLLTTSPRAGYAMVVKDKAAASGAIIGKALGSMEKGSGLIPVMVTLK
jgi:hypothetical protein